MEEMIPAIENTFVAVDEMAVRHPGRTPGAGEFVASGGELSQFKDGLS